jgi:putative inorganic carbon (hco3(-)) transporter
VTLTLRPPEQRRGQHRAVPWTDHADRAAAVGLGCAIAIGAGAALSPYLGLAAAVVLIGLLVLRWWPDAVAALAIATIYSNAVVIGVQRGTVPSAAAALLIAALAFPILRTAWLDRRVAAPPASLWLVLIFAAVQCLSTLFSFAPDVAQAETITSLSQGILVYVLVAYAVVGTRSLVSVVNAVLFVGAALGALSIVQHLTGDYTNTFYGFAQISNALVPGGSTAGADLQPRLAGNIGETNRYGQVLAVLLPLVAARAATTRSILVRVLTIVAGLLIGGGVVFTYSRGAAVALAATMLTLTAMRWVRARWLVGAVVAVVVVALLTPGYADRLNTLSSVTGATALKGSNNAADNAVRGRTTEVLSAILAFADHPVLGVGPGVFPLVSPRYSEEVGIRPRLQEREAHNLFAGIAAETGVLGIGSFLFLLVRILTSLMAAARQWAALDRGRQVLARGFFAAVLVYIYSGMFLHLSYVRYFWLLLGLAAAAARLPGDETRLLTLPWRLRVPWRGRSRQQVPADTSA